MFVWFEFIMFSKFVAVVVVAVAAVVVVFAVVVVVFAAVVVVFAAVVVVFARLLDFSSGHSSSSKLFLQSALSSHILGSSPFNMIQVSEFCFKQITPPIGLPKIPNKIDETNVLDCQTCQTTLKEFCLPFFHCSEIIRLNKGLKLFFIFRSRAQARRYIRAFVENHPYFYRTQVSLGSDLWVRFSLTELPLCRLN